MYAINQTRTFKRWHDGLPDLAAMLRIDARLRRMELGHFGDVKHVGEGVREARIDCGPGYRLYYIHRGNQLIVLLSGGDKSSQSQDIRRAIQLAKAWDQN
ncbi:type II toxin-antitoxin system RelE/ParE family toxin [Bacillus sp. NP157]|nr:type II toxin-antitoxin system RelE/ParE family toxin [Bacillus sp. NP157]